MPRLDEPDYEEPIKGLVLGNSGSGKTGALASLAEAGYQLHIVDFDKGTNIIKHLLKGNREALARVEVESFTDGFRNSGAKVYPYKIQAWAGGLNQLTKWTTQYNTMDHIVVIDSLNFASKAAFRWILQLANRLQAPKEIQDWLAAQELVESFLAQLYSNDVKCHVLVTSHILYFGQGDADIKIGYPMTAVGRSFAPNVARYFNNAILCRNTGTGPTSKREIWTSPIDFVDLKTESLEVKKTYQLKDGLAKLFQDIRKTNPLEHIVEGEVVKPPLAIAKQA